LRGVIIPDDIDDEISQAFENVDLALRSAGGTGWSQVFRVNSYPANLTPETLNKIGEQFRKWTPEHKPIWVALPVERLGVPEMRIEIQVVAYSP
jgi:enamine deaminase RidA (YjgF/YER057c/UK114 family)